jgi:UDP-N-acetyl-D-glucosamine dehydrogenase
MPAYVVSLVGDALNDAARALNGAQVLVLGVAYKPDTDDVRQSPALDVIAELLARKANVSYADPYVPELTVGERRLRAVALTPPALQAADCVVITTDHAGFDWDLVRQHARLVVDTRNALRGQTRPGGARLVKL